MNVSGKDFLKEKAKKLSVKGLTKEVEECEDHLKMYDIFERMRTYTWEEDLYQKISHFPQKLYAYKVDWNGTGIDYNIESEDEMLVWVRTFKSKKLKYFVTNPNGDSAFIKILYEVLKDFIESKKEYRIRAKTGIIEIELDKVLEEILTKKKTK